MIVSGESEFGLLIGLAFSEVAKLRGLVCHILILAMVFLFVSLNATNFIKKSPPHIPQVIIPEKSVMKFASCNEG